MTALRRSNAQFPDAGSCTAPRAHPAGTTADTAVDLVPTGWSLAVLRLARSLADHVGTRDDAVVDRVGANVVFG